MPWIGYRRNIRIGFHEFIPIYICMKIGLVAVFALDAGCEIRRDVGVFHKLSRIYLLVLVEPDTDCVMLQSERDINI